MLWLCISVGISVALHSLFLVISAAPYWTPLSHVHFKSSLQWRPNLRWSCRTLVSPQPLSLPGTTAGCASSMSTHFRACNCFILEQSANTVFSDCSYIRSQQFSFLSFSIFIEALGKRMILLVLEFQN